MLQTVMHIYMVPLIGLIRIYTEKSNLAARAYCGASQYRYLRRGRTAHAKAVLPKKDSVCATSDGICQLTLCF
jgi:hypothetical protein